MPTKKFPCLWNFSHAHLNFPTYILVFTEWEREVQSVYSQLTKSSEYTYTYTQQPRIVTGLTSCWLRGRRGRGLIQAPPPILQVRGGRGCHPPPTSYWKVCLELGDLIVIYLIVCLSVCLKCKISVTTELIGFYSSGNIPTGPVMGLSYFLGA